MSAAAQQSHHQQQARHAAPWLTPGQRRLLAACAATVGVVAAYKVYRSERLKSTHQALQTAADTLARYSDAASSVGQMAAVVAADIRTFLSSDSDEVPRSLRQLAKLARSSDVQDTLAACVASSIKGVLSSDTSAEPGQPTLVDKVIEAVLSDRGQTLVGLAVRTAAHQSTETFCLALRQGLEAALQASGLAGHQQQQQQQQQTPQQQQHQHYASPTSPGGAFYSALSSPATGGSPQQQRSHVPYHVQTFTAYGSSGSSSAAAAAAAGGMHPAVRSVLAVLNSPQLLQAVDGLVSTCVGSTVGAYMAQAGSNDNMLSSVLHTLSQPGNKALVIDIMSQVSATMCREMAAACVAPAAAVASRPSSRLSDSPAAGLSFEDQQTLLLQRQLSASPIRVGPLQMQQQQQAVASSSRSNSASPFKHGGSPQQQQGEGAAAAAAALHHSISEGAFSHVSDAAAGAGDAGSSAVGEDACGGESGSEPSSPQSGPSTPEPSVAAAEAAGGSSQQQQQRQGSYGSFAGSAVAGLILRRQSFGALLGGGGAGGSAGMFNRGGGPVQYVGGAGVNAGAGAGAAGASGPVLVDPSALGPMSTAVSLFVQAARFQEFRSLMIDVTRSSTREFVHSLLPAGWARAVGGSVASRWRGGGAPDSSSSQAVTVALHRVYTAVSVLILLMVYALSPKTILLEGGM